MKKTLPYSLYKQQLSHDCIDRLSKGVFSIFIRFYSKYNKFCESEYKSHIPLWTLMQIYVLHGTLT